MGLNASKAKEPDSTPQKKTFESVFYDILSVPELPAEVWVSVLRFLDTHALGRMSLSSRKWHGQTWPLATAVDSAWVTDQFAFDRIINRAVEECEKTKGLVALRWLAIVPKRVKPSNYDIVLPLINRLTSLKELAIRSCDDMRWTDLTRLQTLLGPLERLRIHDCNHLMNTPQSVSFVEHLQQFKRLQSLELSCSSVKFDFFTALATCSTLKQLILRHAILGNISEHSSVSSPVFSDCLLNLTQLTRLAFLDVTLPSSFPANLFGEAVNKLTRLRTLDLIPAVSQIDIRCLGCCPSVETLRLLRPSAGNPAPDLDMQFPRVRGMCMYGLSSGSNEEDLPFINASQHLTSLEVLYGLCHGIISNASSYISLKSLQLLEMSDETQSLEFLEKLTMLTNLTHLDLRFQTFTHTDIQQKLVDYSLQLTSLVRLGLPVAELNLVRRLSSLQLLQSFSMWLSVPGDDNFDTENGKGAFGNVTELVIGQTITDSYLSMLLTMFGNVQRLHLMMDPPKVEQLVSIATLSRLQTLGSTHRYYSEYTSYPSPHPTVKLKAIFPVDFVDRLE